MPADIAADRAVIDRIVDGTTAVLLVGADRRELQVAADALPEGASEGDWVILDTADSVVAIDHQLTDRRRHQVERRLDRIRQQRSGRRFGR